MIALHQPVTRPEIEGMCGVLLGQASMDVLIEAGLIQLLGRRQATERPTLWATTPQFLAQFGLRSLHDLPLLAGQERSGRRPQSATMAF